MTTLTPALVYIIREWARLNPKIARVWIFGSYASGTAGPASDLDIAFEFAPDVVNIDAELIEIADTNRTLLSYMTGITVKDFYHFSAAPVQNSARELIYDKDKNFIRGT